MPVVIISVCVFSTFRSLPHFQYAFFPPHHHSVTETNYLALLTLREAGESRQIASHPWSPMTLKSACRALCHLFLSG
ncbi:hypothetical protein AGR9A_Cc210480 [Agrobacterium salinitolerans str. Hayward 0363]|nr:hypothetical protein AGR9A_Cc210480 [Agrobacterium salinitolerans str. Hayward 0363]